MSSFLDPFLSWISPLVLVSLAPKSGAPNGVTLLLTLLFYPKMSLTVSTTAAGAMASMASRRKVTIDLAKAYLKAGGALFSDGASFGEVASALGVPADFAFSTAEILRAFVASSYQVLNSLCQLIGFL
jgi:hypothetical protein